jgi:hypothetical protein
MSHEALSKIFALQQEEQRKNEAAAKAARDRTDRERRALATSDVMGILRSLRDVPLKKEFAGVYGANQKFESMIQYYRTEVFEGKTNELMMKMYSGSPARWRCYECRDSGRMLYEHRIGDLVISTDQRDERGFTDLFIAFAAKYLDPQAIADKLGQTPATQPAANQGRRILQAT